MYNSNTILNVIENSSIPVFLQFLLFNQVYLPHYKYWRLINLVCRQPKYITNSKTPKMQTKKYIYHPMIIFNGLHGKGIIWIPLMKIKTEIIGDYNGVKYFSYLNSHKNKTKDWKAIRWVHKDQDHVSRKWLQRSFGTRKRWMTGVFVSCDWFIQSQQIWWLNTTYTYSLTVLKVRNPKWFLV